MNLGEKRTIKSKSHSCFCCGIAFRAYSEKRVFKINPQKNHSVVNTICVCEDCLGRLWESRSLLREVWIWGSLKDKIKSPKVLTALKKHIIESVEKDKE